METLRMISPACSQSQGLEGEMGGRLGKSDSTWEAHSSFSPVGGSGSSWRSLERLTQSFAPVPHSTARPRGLPGTLLSDFPPASPLSRGRLSSVRPG